MLYFKHNVPAWELTMTPAYLPAGARTSGG